MNKKLTDLKKDEIFHFNREKKDFLGLVTAVEYDYMLFKVVYDVTDKHSEHHNDERIFYEDIPNNITDIRVVGFYNSIDNQVKEIIKRWR